MPLMDGKQDQFYSLFFAYSREATINQKKSTDTKTASSNKKKRNADFVFTSASFRMQSK